MAKKDEEPVEEEEEEKKPKTSFEVVEVPTQTALMVRDTRSDAILEDKQVLAEILNKLDNIEKNTG